MGQLPKDVYYTSDGLHPGPFGLYLDQPHKGFVDKSIWFNGDGERIGRGGLGINHFLRIAQNLEAGELFVVLPDSIDDALDLDFVARRAMYIIAPGKIFFVNNVWPHGECIELQSRLTQQKLAVISISPEEAKRLIAGQLTV